jgi:TatD DNase family protein
MYIDSHCHLDFPEFSENIDLYLENMKINNVSHALCISVDVPDFPKIKKLAENYPNLYATVGVHPDYENTEEPTIEWLTQEAKYNKVIGIGETGLDYFRMGDKTHADYEWQRNRFRTHIRAAIAVDKPLVIHTRNSAEDTLKIMREEGAIKVGGVMHCFTESTSVALEAIDLGFYISFSGIVTFKNATSIQQTCRDIPLDRILIETDSPYLAPTPNRGKTNQPAWVSLVADYISNLKGVSPQEIGRITSENFQKLFKLKLDQ